MHTPPSFKKKYPQSPLTAFQRPLKSGLFIIFLASFISYFVNSINNYWTQISCQALLRRTNDSPYLMERSITYERSLPKSGWKIHVQTVQCAEEAKRKGCTLYLRLESKPPAESESLPLLHKPWVSIHQANRKNRTFKPTEVVIYIMKTSNKDSGKWNLTFGNFSLKIARWSQCRTREIKIRILQFKQEARKVWAKRSQ